MLELEVLGGQIVVSAAAVQQAALQSIISLCLKPPEANDKKSNFTATSMG